MSIIGKAEAILSLLPTAEVSVDINNNVTWISPSIPALTDEQINAEINRLENDYYSNQYQRDRAKSYPTIQEQLDMQYWDKINGTNNWQDAINAVKTQYPKETN
jgi:hypothetical protein